MQTLYLLRHAKSSWREPEQPDHARPLKKKGLRHSEAMATQVAALLPAPKRVLSSDAERCRETLPPFLKVWDLNEKQVEYSRDLYLATDSQVLEILRELPDGEEPVLLVGHNPGLTDLANRLTRDDFYLENLVTCGFLQLDFDIESWSELSPGSAELKVNVKPKTLDQ